MVSRGRFGGWVSRRAQRSGLLVAVVAAVVGGLGIAGVAWWILWVMLGARAEPPNQVELTKIALSVSAGVGGAVALVVAYRRQRDIERGRFAELFGAAARQLGDADVAVRIAGVYAMAGVADEFRAAGRRQQCIDVLCGYLRLPYEPEAGANHLIGRTETVEGKPTVELRYQFRQNDREVRRAIVDVIVAHLRPTADVSWSHHDFDFAGAVLEDCDFRSAEFAGQRTYFARTTFIGERATTFEGAKFTGRYVTFRDARFCGDSALFRAAEFANHDPGKGDHARRGTQFEGAEFQCPVSFEQATFRGPQICFRDTTFGELTRFADARFSAEFTDFRSAVFSGEQTAFTGVRFASPTTSFQRATFDGDLVRFDKAEFTGPAIDFEKVRFAAALTAFADTRFGVRPRWRQGPPVRTDFSGAEFRGRILFDDAVLDGRTVDFSGGDFRGEISFQAAKFAAGTIDFTAPTSWVGTRFFWDRDAILKPDNVEPARWPPTPVPRPPDEEA
ncbi:pentapeptide repeat-containing protein [Nocardia sp. NPDC003482]